MDYYIVYMIYMTLIYAGFIASLHLLNSLMTIDGFSYVSLHRAVINRNLRKVKQRLEEGENVNKVEWFSGRTPLHYLRSDDWNDNDLEILQILLDYGASLTKIDDQGKAAFQYLLGSGNRRTVQILLDHDLDLYARDIRGKTPLHYLIQHYDPRIHELIKDKQFNVNARDIDGCSALLIAVMHASVNKLEFLLERGADPNLPDINGWPPLFYAVWQQELLVKETMKVVDLLLEYGADAQQLHFEPLPDARPSVVPIFFLTSVIAHLALIVSKGQVLTDYTYSQINVEPFFQDYFEACTLQIVDDMKEIVIVESITLYKLLTEPIDTIVHYTYNPQFSQKFERTLRSTVNQFDKYYHHLLRRRVGKALKKAQAKNTTRNVVRRLTGFHYPRHRLILNKIVDYLNDVDLKGFYEQQQRSSLDHLFISR